LNTDDIVLVTWSDGDSIVGKFLRIERGFALVQGDDGKIHPCALSHCVIKKVNKIKT